MQTNSKRHRTNQESMQKCRLHVQLVEPVHEEEARRSTIRIAEEETALASGALPAVPLPL